MWPARTATSSRWRPPRSRRSVRCCMSCASPDSRSPPAPRSCSRRCSRKRVLRPRSPTEMAGLRGKALVAYLLVCTVWGSTYLVIRIGVGHLPPFLFAGIRFFIAGLLLGGGVLATGGSLPRRARDWGTLAVTAVFLLVGGNAIVVWAEQFT